MEVDMVEVIDTKEQEDGSLIVNLSLTNEEVNMFIELGVNKALEKSIGIIEEKLKSKD